MSRGTSIQRPPGDLGASREDIVRRYVGPAVLAAMVLTALVVTYQPTIVDLIHEWAHNEDYSVGQLVPFVAGYLLWRQRHILRGLRVEPCWSLGFGLLAGAQALRFYGMAALYESAERYSLVLTIWALVLWIAGWQVFRRVIWVLLFLLLMVPLPGQIHNRISSPLQNLATSGAVFFLELLGTTVSGEGNVIVLNDTIRLAVAEACSGLRMLMAFIVVAAALAGLVRRPRWQKAVLVASSIPVAIACNIIRLFVTAQLFCWIDNRTADVFFHDFAGLTMMPLAVCMLVAELWLLDHLVTGQPDAPNGKRRLRFRPTPRS